MFCLLEWTTWSRRRESCGLQIFYHSPFNNEIPSISYTYRSNGIKDCIPQDGSHVVHEFCGCGPRIHAGGDDVSDRCVIVNVFQLSCKEKKYGERLNFSANDTGIRKKNKKEMPSTLNRSRTYDFPISTSDALPLSYRRPVVAKPLTSFMWLTSRTLLGFECRNEAFAQWCKWRWYISSLVI